MSGFREWRAAAREMWARYVWRARARGTQKAPKGDDWGVWLLMAGRGFGKTRAGAEWVRERVVSGGRAADRAGGPDAGRCSEGDGGRGVGATAGVSALGAGRCMSRRSGS